MRVRHNDPELPSDLQPNELNKGARFELKTLASENADLVAKHLAMVVRLIDSDPELAHQHAISASRRAGRIAIVRETLAITAYRIGDFALALRELRTYRRISGSDTHLAMMIDCERGMGRPDRALELGASVDRKKFPAEEQVSIAIALSGARLDLGQTERALEELEIPQLDPNRAFSYSPDLYLAYAEVLQDLGRGEEAAGWRKRAKIAEEALQEKFGNPEIIDIFDVMDDELAREVDAADAALRAETEAAVQVDADTGAGADAVSGAGVDAVVDMNTDDAMSTDADTVADRTVDVETPGADILNKLDEEADTDGTLSPENHA
ncbi:hypothetical protein [Lysinibacter sp. HNR]|uniref:hypothetical protein n=1 Tax=Lysinibacter sp. HNR TaxID=3031408 RepID=UPI0024356BEF|nr:hypothetical protein [Lysinibacter sp. HNR]WGD36603.1 hypothetical protein FrondiHNR_09020 [Lysinibacter sp. HNR]